MSQLRAVETGRTVVQVATTGMSAVIGPDGGVRDHSGPLFQPAILVDRVPLRSGFTLADRLGAMPEYVLAGIAVLGLIAVTTGWWRTRRKQRSDPSASDRPTPKELAST
jgi:apolipoprotein N-acyltransferase